MSSTRKAARTSESEGDWEGGGMWDAGWLTKKGQRKRTKTKTTVVARDSNSKQTPALSYNLEARSKTQSKPLLPLDVHVVCRQLMPAYLDGS